ncbi:endonuclease/exonuclease/phosphatase family protein [Nocardioides mangrovi]|uniref:Endonuclease/exonuclease/phosphatase family protein n=1 Tax=Nocardioides mangrovi TaxID=2874580 RepID=A0ABS7U8S2_9ACTN|nr:endonuclease/exonuclease/phosphatase family protein [Nocardioides mangrovi]MBZ5737240.1 endonuclease/exonuclease/phosphatase family protein [Nocardioides mangrovi]
MRLRVVLLCLLEAALLLPALLLTIARLVESTGTFWVQVEAFTPLALALYAAALLVALVVLLVRRRRRPAWRSWPAPVAVLAVAGLVLHGWWFAPLVTGANPPPAADAQPLVVMTANLYQGAADGIELVRRVSDADVDLLVLEELTPAVLADMDRAGLDDLLPYRAPADGDGYGDAATMAFSRTPIEDPQPLDLELGGWSFRTDGLTVLAVHPWSPGTQGDWAADQATVAAAVDDLHPDLLAGDFNATVDHAPMRALADEGYRDVGELANDGWQPTWPVTGAFDLLGLPLAQIDHVLVGPRLAAISMRTVDVPGSDHRAVIATVALK